MSSSTDHDSNRDRKATITAAIISGFFLITAAIISGVFLIQSSQIKEESALRATSIAENTQPPLPTYTPYPTYTLIPPEPAKEQPTTAPILPSATNPPRSTATEISDTVPGTILAVGDEWRQNGVGLRLTNYELKPDSGWGENIGVAFEFRNYTNNEIILSFSKDDFIVTTNSGETLEIKGFYNQSFWCNENTSVVKAGGKYNVVEDAACGPKTLLWITADLGNPNLTDVIIRATQFSRITDARWQINFIR